MTCCEEKIYIADVSVKFRCTSEEQLCKCWQDLNDMFGRLSGNTTVEVEVKIA